MTGIEDDQNALIKPFTREDKLLTPYGISNGEETTIIITNASAAPIELDQGERVASWEDHEERQQPESGVNAMIPLDGDNYIEIGDDLSQDQTKELLALLREYNDVLGINGKLGHTDLVKHVIELESDKPVKVPLRRYSDKEKKEISLQTKDMLEQDVITESRSAFSSPIVLVPKKDGGLRFCIDYRQVNKITRKWPYPLPRIDDNLDALSQKSIFSCIDMNSGFWQIEVEKEHRHITAFATPEGHYEFKRMPFGMCNAVSTFQKMADLLFCGTHINATRSFLTF